MLCSALSAEEGEVRVGLKRSHLLQVKGIRRVAVADKAILKVRAFPPHEVLITGTAPGKTTLRIWKSDDTSRAYEVVVLPEAIWEASSSQEQVVRVGLEFYEVLSSRAKAYGIRWPEATSFSASTSGDPPLKLSTAQGIIRHLMEDGSAKLLARPELFVRLGEEATFHSGGEFPISSSSEAFGRLQRHVEWKSYGITVRVKPQSGDGRHLSSEIRAEISDLNTTRAVEGVPAIERRRIETKLTSLDGETILLSGLVRQQSSENRDGLPGLAEFPIFGPIFFRSVREGGHNTEVLMALTLSFRTPADAQEALSHFFKNSPVPSEGRDITEDK